MKYRTIPGTDLRLSVVGFGAWALGGEHWGPVTPGPVAQAAVDLALELGINWFDTAPIYGHSHAFLRRALAGRGQIATKVGIQHEGDSVRSVLTPAHLRADLLGSVESLARPIDLLQVHWPCQAGTPIQETFHALAELQAEGLFRHLGVCNYSATDLSEACRWANIRTIQLRLNLFDPATAGAVAQVAAEQRVAILGFEPLAKGLLSGKFRSAPTFGPDDLRALDDRFRGRTYAAAQRTIQGLRRLSTHSGLPVAALATGWCLARPQVYASIAGMRTPEQVRQNARAHELLEHPELIRATQRLSAPLPPP